VDALASVIGDLNHRLNLIDGILYGFSVPNAVWAAVNVD
jgi:hypothetical protein